MQGRILGFGQAYLETSKDKSGNYLDGDKTYRMHVDANPPVKQFSSITLHDNVTRGSGSYGSRGGRPVVAEANILASMGLLCNLIADIALCRVASFRRHQQRQVAFDERRKIHDGR